MEFHASTVQFFLCLNHFGTSQQARCLLTTTNSLPTIISSISLAFFRILLQMSIVKIVELELKMDVKDDMRAEIITASIRPEINTVPIR